MSGRGVRSVLISLPALLLLAGASPAAADTFCVQPEASCSGPNTFATVQGALDAANGNSAGVRDSVLLGAATYNESGVSDAGGNPVDIVGKGTAQTTITRTGFNVTTVDIGEADSTISALTIEVAPGGNSTGLGGVGDANGIAVTEPAGAGFGNMGVDLADSGSTLNDSTVTMTGGTAVYSANGGTVRGSQLSGTGGFSGFGSVRRSRITSSGTGAILQAGSTIDNSLLMPAAGSEAVNAFSGSENFDVTLRNVTIAGAGSGTGIRMTASQFAGSTPDLSASVVNTIILGMGTDLRADVQDGPQAGTPTAQITIQSSDFDPAKRVTNGGGQIFLGPGSINADPLFVNSAGGDFSLARNSPAVDHGDNGFVPTGPDLAGAQRVVDGDDDGEAVVDMGALEFSRPTTVSTLNAVAIPAVADPGEPIAFIASASDSGGAPLTYGWSFDDGKSGDGQVEVHSFQSPGTHTGTVTVRNPSGSQASATARVQIRGPAAATAASESCAGRNATEVGTQGNDVIHGTAGNDVIVTLGGADKVIAGKGRDVVCGGTGNDKLKGGKGADKLFGEAGNDKLFGGPGRDRLDGGPGKDHTVP